MPQVEATWNVRMRLPVRLGAETLRVSAMRHGATGTKRSPAFAAAAACVEQLWGERLSDTLAAPRDAKTTLQEWAQARRLPLPDYREVGREGPAHAPVFVVDVSIKGHEPTRGRAGSKREAERLAAAALLERLGAS